MKDAIVLTKKVPAVLELIRGTSVLGTIDVKPREPDSPWYSGAFHPAPAFEEARELFVLELQLIQANTADDSAQWDNWEAVHEELHGPGLRLLSPDKVYEADEILIHIDGAEAWWRIE